MYKQYDTVLILLTNRTKLVTLAANALGITTDNFVMQKAGFSG